MKVLVVLASLVCVAVARPGYLGLGALGVLGAGGVPLDTPEVVAARITHAAQVAGAQAGIPPAAVIPGDTPAVIAARATHLAQVAGERVGIPSSLVIPGDTPAVAAGKVSHAVAVAQTAARDAGIAALGGVHAYAGVPAYAGLTAYSGLPALGLGLGAVPYGAPGVLAHLQAKAALLG